MKVTASEIHNSLLLTLSFSGGQGQSGQHHCLGPPEAEQWRTSGVQRSGCWAPVPAKFCSHDRTPSSPPEDRTEGPEVGPLSLFSHCLFLVHGLLKCWKSDRKTKCLSWNLRSIELADVTWTWKESLKDMLMIDHVNIRRLVEVGSVYK